MRHPKIQVCSSSAWLPAPNTAQLSNSANRQTREPGKGVIDGDNFTEVVNMKMELETFLKV